VVATGRGLTARAAGSRPSLPVGAPRTQDLLAQLRQPEPSIVQLQDFGLENHVAATALHFAHYNFVRRHQTLRVTPATAAGVSATLWDVDDLLNATIGSAP
jgi:hypothetical protein